MTRQNNPLETYYFDNSATTKPLDEVVLAMTAALEHGWGNPSSLHRKGLEAEKIVNQGRLAVAASLGVAESTILFAPSGTAATNAAIGGAMIAGKRRGNHIITGYAEHSATWNTVAQWVNGGAEASFFTPKLDGSGVADQLKAAIKPQTVLVSLMAVHNETGTIFPVEELARLVKTLNPNTLVHCDAVQAYLKIPIHLKDSAIDLLTLSAHKVHGPKGIGALYQKPGVNLPPFIFGGGQEKGIFSGTDNVAGVAGFGKAATLLAPTTEKAALVVAEHNSYLRRQLAQIPQIKIITPENGLPYVLAITMEGYRSEVVLHHLEAKNIFVSSGSACAKGKPSRSLLAFGLSKSTVDGFLRISMNRFTQTEDLDYLVAGLADAARQIRSK